MSYSNVLKLIRNKKKLTQKEVAELCGITPQYLSYVENGSKTPSISLLKSLSKVYDIPSSIISYLTLADLDEPITTKKHGVIISVINEILKDLFIKDSFNLLKLKSDLNHLKELKNEKLSSSPVLKES